MNTRKLLGLPGKGVVRSKRLDSNPRSTLGYFQNILSQIVNGQPVQLRDRFDDIVTHGYERNTTVFSIVDWIGKKAQLIELVPYEVKDEKAAKGYKNLHPVNKQLNTPVATKLHQKAFEDLSEDEEHPLTRLLTYPNPKQTIDKFIYEFVTQSIVTGFDVLYSGQMAKRGFNANIPEHLFNLPSLLVELVAGNALDPIKEVRFKENYQDYRALPSHECCVVNSFSFIQDLQGSHLYGRSAFSSGRNTLRMDNDAETAGMKLLQHAGVMGLLSSKELITDAAGQSLIKELKKDIEDRYGHMASEYGSLLGSSIPLEYHDFAKSLQDLQVVPLSLSNQRKLCNLLQVQSVLWNDPDMGKFKNMGEARKISITDGVLPHVQSLVNHLNLFVAKPYGLRDKKKYVIEARTHNIPELSDDLEKIYAMLEKSDYLSVDEKRAIINQEPLETDLSSEPLVDRRKIPLSHILDDPIGELLGSGGEGDE